MIELTQHNETVSRDSGRNRLRKRVAPWEIAPAGPAQTRRAVVPQAVVLSESYTLVCTAMVSLTSECCRILNCGVRL